MGAVVESAEGGLTSTGGADGAGAEACSFEVSGRYLGRLRKMVMGAGGACELHMSGQQLTGSIADGRVERCADNADVKWFVRCCQAFDMSEMGERRYP